MQQVISETRGRGRSRLMDIIRRNVRANGMEKEDGQDRGKWLRVIPRLPIEDIARKVSNDSKTAVPYLGALQS